MLQLKDVKKSYTTGDFTQVALDGINLTFRKQEFVAILGPSGSGKTTSLNVIGGLDSYDSGDLIINGKSTKSFKDRDWDAYRNNSVGFVFQSYNLITHLSILDNVEMSMTLSGVGAGEKRRKALLTLERVGLKDHVHKKPTQLSGGQMQRVAIARALVNDPDIILADEPTGALDTTTSAQIMDLIKEIAEDKLVVMVTHNPELAKKYADRIVEFRDGKIISDSNPCDVKMAENDYMLRRTAMGYLTALKLSGKNILTKKWRTALTAFASSIGIIGIALIMSLSNGLQGHIDAFEEDAASQFPVLISRQAIDFDADFMTEMQEMQAELNERLFTDEATIFIHNPEVDSPIHLNQISDEFIDYVASLDPSIVRAVTIMEATGMNLVREVEGEYRQVNLENQAIGMAAMMQMGMPAQSTWPLMQDTGAPSYLEENFDLLMGDFPAGKEDVMLIVDAYNRINISVLESLGFETEDLETISFDEIVGTNIRLIANNDFFMETEFGNFMPTFDLEAAYHAEASVTLTVAGILRPKNEDGFTTLNPGIVYSQELLDFITSREGESDIVQAQLDSDVNVMTMDPIDAETKEQIIAHLGGERVIFQMLITPTNIEAQGYLLSYLDAFNEGLDDEYRIVYIDQAAIITTMLGGILNGVTFVLVGFAAISLVVSLIMIAIITYISVMERTKEIGILRALGARKKDITRVFNAETFIIGSLSGILAITVAYLLTFPINNMIYNAVELENVASLHPLHATVLLILSLILTLLGGLIPARLAAKKDPVAALRAE